MAQVGGRNSWLAIPVGVICVVIVAALIWLSLPMVPVAVAWTGDTLRAAGAAQAEPAPGDRPAAQALAGETLDCRAIYPDGLWSELIWQGRTRLDQSVDPPATTVDSLVEVLAPHVLLSCSWAGKDDAAIDTTLSAVGGDASALAEAALRGQGFDCAVEDAVLRCSRTESGVREEQIVREGLWLSSVQHRWDVEDYSARIERQLWG